MASEKNLSPTTPKVLKFFSAGMTLVPTTLIKAPFSRALTVLQTQGMIPSIQTPYKGGIRCLLGLYKQEGFKALFRGVSAELVSLIPKSILPFVIGNRIAELIDSFNPKQEKRQVIFGSLLSGVLMTSWVQLYSNPFEVIRVRLQADVGSGLKERQFSGLVDCFKKIYNQHGIRGFYRGFFTSLLGYGSYRALYFGLYEAFRRISFDSNLSIFQKFAVAQFITMFSSVATYPIETIRKRLNMQAGQSNILYTGIYDCASKMIAQEGVRSLFRGVIFRLGMSVFSAMGLTFYDQIAKKNKK